MSDLTFRQLYRYLDANALDGEVIMKPDGRGTISFRDMHGRGGWVNFDFEREAEHLPENEMAKAGREIPR